MEKIKVFELAKQLSVPVKELIQKMKIWGIVVESHFNLLTEEQISLIKKKLSSLSSDEDTNTLENPERKRKVIRRTVSASETEATPETKTPPKIETPFSEPEVLSTATPESPIVGQKIARRIRKSHKSQETSLAETIEPSTSAETVETIPPPVPPVVETKTEAPSEPPQPQEPIPSSVALTTPAPHPLRIVPPITRIVPSPSLGNNVPGVTKDNERPGNFEKRREIDTSVDRGRPKEVPKKMAELPSRLDKKGKPLERDLRWEKKGVRPPEDVADIRIKKPPRMVTFETPEEGEGEEWVRPRRKRLDRRERQKEKLIIEQKHVFNPRKKSIIIHPIVTVGELAGAIGIKASEIIKKLMELGMMVTINQSIPGETAALIAADFNVEVVLDTFDMEDILNEDQSEQPRLPRAPIVTIMGHVDHGKTSLLDKIRSTHVTVGEAGGITQHIGAYHVNTNVGDITFLDTPGHEAFTAMRARGAHVTDIVVLVVAADDGVQPQTIEAIHHAQAAKVPIVVAVNKIDRPEANPLRVQQALLEHGLVSENFGGETIFVNVSAKSGEGIEALLEMLHLQAEILELTAPIEGNARGIIIESKISKGRGPVGTVLIQQGTLHVGDYYIVGGTYGRVRAMFDDLGQAIESAIPSVPVEVLGFNEVPKTGERFIVMEDEKTARQIADTRAQKTKDQAAMQRQKMHLETLFSRMSTEEQIELKILIKGDVQGSVEALQNSLFSLGKEKVKVRFIHSAVGSITETDVMLASASDAIIIGFNAQPEANAKAAIAREGIDVRGYSIIYDAIEDVKNALEGMLKPVVREEIIGHCEVRQLYNTSKSGIILGCYVTDGHVLRNANIRVLRKESVVYDGQLLSLKRFKDDVREVLQNYECGIGIEYPQIQVGDVLEAYVKIQESAKL